jgi:hypothetical protein
VVLVVVQILLAQTVQQVWLEHLSALLAAVAVGRLIILLVAAVAVVVRQWRTSVRHRFIWTLRMVSQAATVSLGHRLLVAVVAQVELAVQHRQEQVVWAFRSIHSSVARHCSKRLGVAQVQTQAVQVSAVQVLQQQQRTQRAVVVVLQAAVQVLQVEAASYISGIAHDCAILCTDRRR